MHGGLTSAWANTSGQKILNLSEVEDHAKQDRTTVRRWNWAAAMGGASAVQVMWMGRASDRPAWNEQGKYDDCARLMDFMESATLLNTLSPRDDLALGATQWVLAKPGHGLHCLFHQRRSDGTQRRGRGRLLFPLAGYSRAGPLSSRRMWP